MKLTITQAEFEHQKDDSVYNHNYYKHKKLGYTLLEECHEDENYYDYLLVEGDKEIFIGHSLKCAFEGGEDIAIEFKESF
jgi:hypothetical protein